MSDCGRCDNCRAGQEAAENSFQRRLFIRRNQTGGVIVRNRRRRGGEFLNSFLLGSLH